MPKATHSGNERVVKEVLSKGFANQLPERIVKADASLLAELRSNISSLQTGRLIISGNYASELDQQGTELWNLTARWRRRDDDSNNVNACLLVRVFAFYLLDCVKPAARRTAHNNLRLLKIANKAAKLCLEQDDTENAQSVLSSAASTTDALDKQLDGTDASAADSRLGQETISIHRASVLEYLMMRIMLAWKQGRLEIAEAMFSKVEAQKDWMQPASAETLADLLYEVGKAVHRNGDSYRAAKWLERAHQTLSEHDMETLSADAGEMRLSIIHLLVRSLIEDERESAQNKARHLLSLMENEYGNRMAVLVLQLDLATRQGSFEADKFYSALHRMVRTVHITSTNFKTILYYVHKLKAHDRKLACRALDDLLTLRLFVDRQQEWAEKALVTRIWLSTEDASAFEVESIKDLLDRFITAIEPLTSAATHAIQTLLWKQTDYLITEQHLAAAENLCRLLLHGTFQQAGQLNQAKIQRKLATLALASGATAKARQVCNQMPDETRSAALSQYLLYRIALRDGDSSLAATTLQSICRSHAAKDATLLYACVLEAQASGDRRQAIMALQEVTRKFNYAAPCGVHLPALLRCTARLLISELQRSTPAEPGVIAELCQLFNGAASQARTESAKQSANEQQFTDTELQWFLRNSYNLCLSNYGEWATEQIMLLLEACQTFQELALGRQPTDAEEIRRRGMVIDSLLSQCSIKAARAEQDEQAKLRFYLKVRQQVERFRQTRDQTSMAASTRNDGPEASHIWGRLICHDFEACIHLKVWDALTKMVNEAGTGDKDILAKLAEMLLASEAPQQVMVTTLEAIVSQMPASSISTTARWLRILYHLCTATNSGSTESTAKATVLINRAVTLADNAPPNDQYPTEELEWLATTTFNRAVDAYCSNDEEGCRARVEEALKLAERLTSRDGGSLRDAMVKRASGLLGVAGGDKEVLQ